MRQVGATGHVPQADAVPGCRGQQPGIATKAHPVNPCKLVPRRSVADRAMVQRATFAAIGYLPDPELQSLGTSIQEGQAPIIRAKAKAGSSSGHQQSTADRIPKPGSVIPCIRSQQISGMV